MNEPNDSITVEVTLPTGESVSYSLQVSRRMLCEALEAIHTNEYPYLTGRNLVEEKKRVEKKSRDRDGIVSEIANRICDSFNKYFKEHDTLNGYKIKDN